MKIASLRQLAFLSCLLVTWPAISQQKQLSQEKLTTTAAAINLGSDATLRSTRSGFQEISVDLEDLGIDDSANSFLVGFDWRWANRWSVGLKYFRFETDGARRVADEFNFDGQVYPFDAAVAATYEMDLWQFELRRALIQQQSLEVGFGVGLHAIDITTSLTGSLDGNLVASAGASALAPLPNLRGYLRYALSPRLELDFSLGWLGLDIDQFDGELVVADAQLTYRLTDRWSFGAVLLSTNLDVGFEDDLRNEAFDVDLNSYGFFVEYVLAK